MFDEFANYEANPVLYQILGFILTVYRQLPKIGPKPNVLFFNENKK